MIGQKITLDTLLQNQGLNPKDLFLVQFFNGYNGFFDTCIANCQTIEERVDMAIGLIVATCPDTSTKNKMFDEYLDYKKRDYGSTTAAAFVIGSLLSYVSETMQLVDKADYSTNDNGYGGKPKVYYLMEIDQLLEKYKEQVINYLPNPEQRIEAATALCIARFPEKEKREEMWKQYVSIRESKSQINASIISAASLFDHISKEFELTSVAYMGF